MKPRHYSASLLIVLLAWASVPGAGAQTFFKDSFDTADGEINTGLAAPRQSGTHLPGGGAWWFHASGAAARPLPAISNNSMFFDGTTGAGGSSTLNLDGPGYLLRSAAVYDGDNDPLTPDVTVEGTTGAALNFGGDPLAFPTSIVGKHYTVRAKITTSASSQTVDKLGIALTNSASSGGNLGTYAAGKILATVQKDGAIRNAVSGVGNNGLSEVTTYIDSTGGPIPKGNNPPPPVIELLIDVDETQSPAVFTIYIDRSPAFDTPRPVQTGTITFGAANDRFLAIWGDGNVPGNTKGTVDDVILQVSPFLPPAAPILWRACPTSHKCLRTGHGAEK